MHSIFFRIYMGMLVAIMLITVVITLSVYYLSKQRITDHIYQNYSGTFYLISQGIARHSGSQRQQWLSAIERLSDLKFKAHDFSDKKLTDHQLGQLIKDKFYFQVDSALSSSYVYILLPEQQNYLSVQLDDFGSSLVRISAFLMLNELGRHKKTERPDALEGLRSRFNYSIQLKSLMDINVSITTLRTIKKGDIAVVVNVSGVSGSTMTAYAPIGNSPYVLVLDNIPFFDWFPLWLIIAVALMMLIFMAAASFYLVRPLEQRLAEVDRQIEQIGHDKEVSESAPIGFDAIGKLSNTVNAMAARIHKLIDAQDDMVRAISHELRAPITRIRFRLASMENQFVEQQHIQGVERNLDELETLIDEVLTFSKLKRERPELQLDAVNIEHLLQELLKKQAPCGKTITLDVSEHQVFADQRFLTRAIENLLLNAMKYASTKIAVKFFVDHNMNTLWIEDDGPGIPKLMRNDIFQAFKRIDASRNRQSGGYGLGLAIVKQVARWHGGDVTVQDSKFQGAKLVFTWPRNMVNCRETNGAQQGE
ncbi:two-component sensor histidine kinase [Thalassotalea insulae]|uniref:histidine kinase n=1 Tax=Thalassotalea insulae TaxID=2056778 RepID=A0ABQ6GWQ0_9GAMM|nr:ATP-binding protein [Thalassotalea insulae]GLX80292.1 two-component sensor histidine kinase [Thalassotalea insulae]